MARNMTSRRPYLIRAIYEWIVDNDMSPYIVVNANYKGAQVPTEYVEDGRIVLNISPEACRGLHLENDRIIFTARFGGLTNQVFVPPESVIAIYSKENGRGMVFDDPKDDVEKNEFNSNKRLTNNNGKPISKPGRPNLKLIK